MGINTISSESVNRLRVRGYLVRIRSPNPTTALEVRLVQAAILTCIRVLLCGQPS